MVEVLLAGWGEKEGGRFLPWKRRFFVLRTATVEEKAAHACTHTLLYYKALSAVTSRSPPLGAVPISKATQVSEAFKKCRGSARRCLQVATPGRKTIFICPEEETEEWTRILSTLEPPPDADKLRSSTFGDSAIESVTFSDADDGAESGDGAGAVEEGEVRGGDDDEAAAVVAAADVEPAAAAAAASVPGVEDTN
mmetsp:Transcript_35315/g.106442  ORF Transcript_35315/g.106442 Transcript_35315/m.106442 type:complete len:195 (+) Transcript_35315:242-826(+)